MKGVARAKKLAASQSENLAERLKAAITSPKWSILDEAKAIIYGDREKTYGKPDKNLQLIASLWSDYISAKYGDIVSVSIDDVCVMMVLLKAARLANDPKHRDSQVDACGYFALMERVQQGENK